MAMIQENKFWHPDDGLKQSFKLWFWLKLEMLIMNKAIVHFMMGENMEKLQGQKYLSQYV